MKKSPLVTILLWILGGSAICSLVLCWMHISASREMRSLQTQMGMVNNNKAIINQLIAEAVEYSKTHPDMDPILESAGVRKTPGTASTNRPAGK